MSRLLRPQADCPGAEMTQRVAEAEQQATPPEPPEAHAAWVGELVAVTAAAAAEEAELAAQSAALSEEDVALAARRAEVAAARARADADALASAEALRRVHPAGLALPPARSKARPEGAHPGRRKHAALYPLLTGLQWDFAAPPGRWKGCVLDAAGGDVRQFNLDAEGATPVQLADSLWALI